MTETMKERLIKKFEDEIQTLNHELKLELPKEIKRARELGDLRENAEYHAAKERQRLVEARISMLTKRASEIALMNIDRIPKDRAGFGSTLHVVGALFAAVDGSQRLWDDRGFWRAPDVQSLYAWRAMPRLIFWSLALAVAIVLLPIAAIAAGLVVYPIDFVMKMVGAGGALGLVGSYVRFAESAFAPEALPTWLPRLAVLVLGATAIVVTIDGWIHSPPRGRGAFWWRATRAPLSSRATIDRCWRVMWDLVRGAAQLQQPPPAELGRRYVELLSDNLGQPGF